MNKEKIIFPEKLPEISIVRMNETPFVARVMQSFDKEFGEKSYSAEYDNRNNDFKKKSVENESYIKGLAEIHGVRCLEFKETVGLWDGKPHEVTEFVVVTDTHIKTIAAMEECGGVNGLLTFLDKEFDKHWGVGENNCGEEIEMKVKELITCDENEKLYTKEEKPGLCDIVGRYKVVIGGKEYDTIRKVYVAADGQVSDFYYDINGEQILKRYFVLDTWGLDDKVKKLYSERWPNIEYLYFNDIKRVCTTYIITSYVL